jgi:sn-glycerol 3-phosphate transport system permease protein
MVRASPSSARARAHRRKEEAWALGLVLPAFGLFFLFYVVPLGQAVWLSIHQEDLFSRDLRYSGLENYRQVLGSCQDVCVSVCVRGAYRS